MAEGWPLVVILGPTASGKSALGIHLAHALGGSAQGGCAPGAEVLACDSTQVYRYFDIGTGKVPASEQQGVPHHLTDWLEPEELITAGDYQRRARAVLAEVRGRARVPIVTAGTGLYLRALLEGLSPLPPRSPAFRARLEERAAERGSGYLHRLLRHVDPASAAAIARRDTPKLIRALEVYFSAPGGSASDGQAPRPRTRTELFARLRRERLEGYAVVKIGLMPPRAELYARIEQRVEKMLEAGWVEETRRLLARFPAYVPKACGTSAGRPPSAKPFGFIGYKQLARHLRGELSLKEAIKQIKHETRQFAKRQITWFRKEPGVKWYAGFGEDAAIQAQSIQLVRQRIIEKPKPA